MGYTDFSLKIEPRNGDSFPVLVLSSPAGEGRGSLQLPYGLAELTRRLDELGLAVRFSSEDPPAEDPDAESRTSPQDVGNRLFEALFPGSVRSLFDRSLGRVEDAQGEGLRIKLHLDPADPDLMLLASLPWELIFRQDRREYLSLGRTSPLVRTLDVPRPGRPLDLAGPLRLLIAMASPTRLRDLKPREEGRRIAQAVQGIPGAEVRFLEHTTAAGLRQTLHEEMFHVLHFVGHGRFEAGSGEGVLVLEDGAGGLAPLPGAILGDLLRDFTSLRLVFLNACDTAQSSRRQGLDPFAGVATALVMAGLPAVVAMQFPISNTAAVLFSEAFYRRLAAGDPVDAATVEGRMAIHIQKANSLEWATPVLFLRSRDGVLFERPSAPILPPEMPSSPEIHRHVIDDSALVADKTAGFVGRRWLFDAVDGFLRSHPKGYFVLRGDPGIGKTSFLAELAKRRGTIHHFNVRAAGIQRPETFLANVCAQLIETYRLGYSALPPEATQGSTFLSSLLGKVAAKLGDAERTLIVVDALDEADSHLLGAGVNTLYLPTTLPAHVFVVASTRRGEIALRVDCDLQTLDLEQDSEGNLADVRELVESFLPHGGIRAYIALQKVDETTFVDELVAKSQGNFMYLRYVLPEIESGAYRDRDFSTLPEGLENYYEDLWKRLRAIDESAWLNLQVPVLVALTQVSEPISVDLISDFSGVEDHRGIRRLLRDWDAYLYSTEVEENGRLAKRYRLYHQSFQDFIAAKDEVAGEHVDLKAANRRISDALLRELDLKD